MDAVTVCNAALGQLGEGRLAQLDEVDPLSNTEALCVTYYPMAVRAVTEEGAWTFATEWLELAALTGELVDPNYTYAFELPSEVVVVRYVDDGSGYNNTWHRVVGRRVYANVEPLYLCVTKQIDDPNYWTPNFTLAVTFKLAELLATAITENASLSANLASRYRAHVTTALVLDGRQGTKQSTRYPDPRTARY